MTHYGAGRLRSHKAAAMYSRKGIVFHRPPNIVGGLKR